MPPALFEFLQKNQIEKSTALPAVHSTEAYFIKKFMASSRIEPSICKFFGGEKLSYFFVGRPAFKRNLDREPDYWELPICFIVDYRSIRRKRVFPFDSGAFKSGNYPSFISIMDLNEFALERDSEAVEKIVGTFFGTNRSYFMLKSRGQADFEARFDVGVLEEEVKALHKLITLKHEALDDRRFAIEIQTEHEFALVKDQVLAVVLPETYIENVRVVRFVERELNAKLLTYPLFPLKKDYYYYAIYERVDHFFRQAGFYRV
jgi:hypothetical protein